MYGLVFNKGHKLYEVFDRKLQDLFVTGIIERNIRITTDRGNPKRFAHLYRDGPEVLTMEHLEASFVICLAPLSLALIAFLFEWIIRIVEYTICKSIFKAFYQRQMCTKWRIATSSNRRNG